MTNHFWPATAKSRAFIFHSSHPHQQALKVWCGRQSLIHSSVRQSAHARLQVPWISIKLSGHLNTTPRKRWPRVTRPLYEPETAVIHSHEGSPQPQAHSPVATQLRNHACIVAFLFTQGIPVGAAGGRVLIHTGHSCSVSTCPPPLKLSAGHPALDLGLMRPPPRPCVQQQQQQAPCTGVPCGPLTAPWRGRCPHRPP